MPQRETRSAVPATTCCTQGIVPCTRRGRNGGEGGGAVCCQSSPYLGQPVVFPTFQAPPPITFPRISTGPQTYTLRHFLKPLKTVTNTQIKAYNSHRDKWAPKCPCTLAQMHTSYSDCTLSSWGGGGSGGFWSCKPTLT